MTNPKGMRDGEKEELREVKRRLDAHESRLKILQKELEGQTMFMVIVAAVVASLVALLIAGFVL